MSTIKIHLFHTPEVLLDNEPVAFPYKKAEALFYYIAIEKSITRDRAVGLLWEDSEETVARKNLRHALYIINKLFGTDIIVSPKKYVLNFNYDVDSEIDLDLFLKDNSSVDLYAGQLLQGFNIKNAYAFEEWLAVKQNSIKDLYLSRLYSNLSFSAENQTISEVEHYAGKYMQEDPLDERIYLLLMEKYKEQGLFHKGITVYQKLSSILSEELGITPNKEITALYHQLLSLWSENSTAEADSFSLIPTKTREDNLAVLQSCFQRFLDGEAQNVMILGENGIGKTHLINTFLTGMNSAGIIILKTSCFQAEKEFPLQPWNTIMLKIDEYISQSKIEIPPVVIHTAAQLFPTFGSVSTDVENFPYGLPNNNNYRAGKNAIVKIFQYLTKHTKILFIIDNIHSMDSLSLELLSSLICVSNPDIMTILTSLDTMDYDLVTFTSSMVKENFLVQIPLKRLTRNEMVQFIGSALGNETLDEKTIDLIYKETLGNIFFLTELLNNLKTNRNINELSLNAQGILNDRLNGISVEARRLLDIISLFHDYVTLPVLSIILGKNPLELLDIIEELKERALITEKNDNDKIYFVYTHNKMREFIYNKLSPSKSRILHNRAGEALEQVMTESGNLSGKKLIYHYSLGDNVQKVLYYKILNIEKFSGISYELYPILETDSDEYGLPSEEIMEYFRQLELELYKYANMKNFAVFNELEARLLHSKSRYCTLTGYYEEGLRCINLALENPFGIENADFRLKLLRQVIYYSIQICDIERMNSCIKDGISLSEKCKNQIENAIYLRLRGLFFIMTGDYRQAIAALLKSIDLFEKSNLNIQLYALNIAAAYNYLGELHLRQRHFNDAMNYYKKAIFICTDNGCPVNPTFYTNIGKAYFFLKEFDNSYESLLTACDTYKNSLTLVGRTVAEAFTALFEFRKGNFNKGLEYMKSAESSINMLKSPYETGILRFVQYLIASEFGSTAVLKENADFYLSECRKLVLPFRDESILGSISPTA